MIQIKTEDAKFLEQHGASIKFTSKKHRAKAKKGQRQDEADGEVLSTPHAKITDNLTKQTWIDWTPGDTEEEAAANAIEAARNNMGKKPVTPIEAVQKLQESQDRVAELEAQLANKQGDAGSSGQENTSNSA